MKYNNPAVEKALQPDIQEEFIVKATIEDEKGKDFVVSFKGSTDDCREWVLKVSRTFTVLKYEIEFIKAEIIMI